MRKNNLIFEANKRGFAGMDYAAEEMLRAGFSFIYDANNNKRATRDKLSALAIRNGALPIVVWIRLPESVAKERAITRDKTADQPSFDAELFDEVVKRQAANFDIPDPAENLIEVNGEVPFDEQYTYFNNALQQLRDA